MKTSEQKLQAAHEAAMTVLDSLSLAITVRFSFWWSWNLNALAESSGTAMVMEPWFRKRDFA